LSKLSAIQKIDLMLEAKIHGKTAATFKQFLFVLNSITCRIKPMIKVRLRFKTAFSYFHFDKYENPFLVISIITLELYGLRDEIPPI
jgi:hypothetical protein